MKKKSMEQLVINDLLSEKTHEIKYGLNTIKQNRAFIIIYEIDIVSNLRMTTVNLSNQ